jgi:Flp pilus assembly protein TadG
LKFRHAEEGDALIELAAALPILLLIICYMVDGALWIQQGMQLQAAASAGAAYGAIPGNSGNHSTMVQLANYDATGNLNGVTGFTAAATDFYSCTPGGTTVTATTICASGAPYHYVKVTTSYTSNGLISLPGIPSSMSPSAVAIYRVEVTP